MQKKILEVKKRRKNLDNSNQFNNPRAVEVGHKESRLICKNKYKLGWRNQNKIGRKGGVVVCGFKRLHVISVRSMTLIV